jgi:hypothetical protein
MGTLRLTAAIAAGGLATAGLLADCGPTQKALRCTVVVSSAHPLRQAVETMTVKTVVAAQVSTILSSGAQVKPSVANALGLSTVLYGVGNSPVGKPVKVNTTVTKGFQHGVCVTSYTPAALPGVAPAAQHPARGALPDPVKVLPHPALGGRAVVGVPVAVDLKPWTVPVGDQGQVGSCVEWAISYGMMGWYSRYQGGSAQGIASSPMYVYSQIHIGQDAGSYPADAYQVGNLQGVDTQDDYSQGNYDWQDQPTAAERANAANYKAATETVLFSTATAPGSAADLQIEQSVAAFHPVALTIPVYSAFDRLSSGNSSLDASQVDPANFRGLHEVLIVGYDATGVTIQNSWGTSWGNAGFAHLNWNFVEQYAREATTTTGLLPSPSPQVPSAPTSMGVSDNNISTAAVTWQPPASGSPITGYRVSRDGIDQYGTGAWFGNLPATARSFTFQALKPGSSYGLSITAINAQGAGPAAAAIVQMGQDFTAPADIQVLPNRAGHAGTLSWTPPTSDGGSPITGYRVTRDGTDAYGTGVWTTVIPASSRAFTFLSLNWGTTYNLSVQAVTAKTTSLAGDAPLRL